MKRTALPFTALLVSACSALNPSPGPAGAAASNAAAAVARWQAAYDSRDPARIVSMYAPDAVFWGTSAKTLAATPQAVAEYFQSAPARPSARVEIGSTQVQTYGDISIASGAYTFRDVTNGQATVRPARYTMVFRKVSGDWLLVNHHSSWLP